MIYDVNGNPLSSAYDVEGTDLDYAYDVDGDIVFQKGTPINVKVMTYNCGQWYIGSGSGISTENESAVKHRQLLNAIMTAQDPDILCIQEYWGIIGNTSVITMLSEYFPYIQEVIPTGSSYFRHAVCSKYPISNFMTAKLEANPTFVTVAENTNTGRFIDRFNVVINDKTYTVFNTHFGDSSSVRADNTDWLLSAMSGLSNVIVLGDLNCTCLNTSDADYIGVINKFLTAGYKSGNCTNFGFINTYASSSTTMAEGRPNDDIVVSSNIRVNNVYVDTTKLTDDIVEKIDHLPLVAELIVY